MEHLKPEYRPLSPSRKALRAVLRIVAPTWKSLNGTIRSPLVKISAIVPLVGYFLLYNDDIIRYLERSHVLKPGILLCEGARLKLDIIYFGAVSLALSGILFALRKPSVVDFRGDEYHYIKNELNVLQDERLRLRYARRIVEEVCGFMRVRRWLTKSGERLQLRERLCKKAGLILNGEQVGLNERDLWDYYALNVNSRLLSRLTVKGFYLIGVLSVAIVSLDTLGAVISTETPFKITRRFSNTGFCKQTTPPEAAGQLIPQL